MLADAFAAERLRLSKAWGTLFWSLLFAPIVAILIGVISASIQRVAISRMGGEIARAQAAPVDLGRAVVEAMSYSDLIPVQLLFMIAAAAIFAGDYRWETWRLLTPRNTRANLILGKLATFALVAAIGLLLLALAGLISGLLNVVIPGLPAHLSHTLAGFATQFAGSFMTSWLELTAMGALAACIAIVSRNGVAALLAPVALWLVQLPIIERVQGMSPGATPLQSLAALPALCADVMRVAILGGGERPAETPFALIFLLGWVLGLTALAILLFRRQDLTRE